MQICRFESVAVSAAAKLHLQYDVIHSLRRACALSTLIFQLSKNEEQPTFDDGTAWAALQVAQLQLTSFATIRDLTGTVSI